MKLPTVLAQTGVPGEFPVPHASLQVPAEVATIRAGQEITGSATDFNVAYGRFNAHLAEDEARAEFEQAKNNWTLKLAEYDVRLKTGDPQQGVEPVDPRDYPTQLGKGMIELATTESAQMRSPQARGLFQRYLAQESATQIKKAMYDALAVRTENIKFAWGVLQQQDEHLAVDGTTPEIRQQALQRLLARPEEGLQRRYYTGEQAQAMTLGSLRRVEEGQIQKDLQSPELRAGVISTLVSGGYKYIDADTQRTMAATLQNQSDQEYKATREAIATWFEEQKQAKVSDLFAQAGDKTLTIPELEQARQDWRLSRTDYAAILNELTRPAEEVPSDAATLLRIDGDVHSQFPRMREQDLDKLRQSGALNRKDYLAAKDRLRETREGLLNRGDSLQMRRHSQAEQEGMADLGIPLIFDKLEPTKEKLRAAFMTELRTRSNAYGGQEDALAIKDEIMPRYKRLLDQDAQLTIEQVQRLIHPHYPTPQALKQAYDARLITKGEYEAQKKLFLDLDTAQEIQRANQRASQERKAGGAKGTPDFGRK